MSTTGPIVANRSPEDKIRQTAVGQRNFGKVHEPRSFRHFKAIGNHFSWDGGPPVVPGLDSNHGLPDPPTTYGFETRTSGRLRRLD